jgi:mono/diheme cytochrome c family protein
MVAIAMVALIGGWLWFGQDTGTAGDDPLAGAPDPLTEGEALYLANCASCHGVNGEGQPNWRTPNDQGIFPAPPHNDDGHTWHHPDQQLLGIIAQGGSLPNSGMPGFADILTQLHMETVLAHIKTFWGADQLKFQTEVTQAREVQDP